jgi:hypothetical protein
MNPAEAIYLLCAATSLLAAGMLLRQYRRRRSTLLLWSVVAFAGLAVSNVLVYVDLVLLPTATDLALIRSGVSAAAMLALVYGLIWEANA